MAEKILVTGATGKIGRELVPLLLEAGVEVKAGTRTPDRGRTILPADVEVVELNYLRTETYDDALIWADRIFLMPPPFSPDAYDDLAPFLDWAVSNRVRHVVLLSGMTVPRKDELPLYRVERHLEAQDTEHTILRPNLYLQNFLAGFVSASIREEGLIRLPAGEGQVSFVDVRDVAAVAARALVTRDHVGQAYTLTGGEAPTLEEAATTLSGAAGRSIRYEAVSDDEFRRILGEEDWSQEEIEAILGLFGSVRKGWRGAVHSDVEDVLGRPARRLAAFAEEHADAWR